MNIEKIHSIFLNCNAVCTDTRKLNKGDLFFALKGDNFNGNKYAQQAIDAGAKYAIIDEPKFKTSSQIITVDDVLVTLQKLATYHRLYLNIPIIALTGSNGKTTTKELIHTVLSKKFSTSATIGNFNNHIGVPLTLLSMTKGTDIGVVEMGANHLNEIAFLCNIAKPDYGYITNFGKAHLEGFGGVEGVIKGKSEIYQYLFNHDKLIFINNEDPIQVEKTKNHKHFSFGSNNLKSHVEINFKSAQPYVECSYNGLDIKSALIGDYNFNNIGAAITIGNYFKVDDSKIKTAIENYIPKNNRSQIIKKDSNNIILDAYNANPTSMKAALSNFNKLKGNKTAILGDMFELGNEAKLEHSAIANFASSLNLDQIILVGENFYAIDVISKNTKKYKSFTELTSNFTLSSLKNHNILIKGSRGMALERLLD